MPTEVDGFSNIPHELIIEIFLWCLPGAPYQKPDPTEAPILFTHVCSSWRIFASQVPELWRSILLSDGSQIDLTVAQAATLNQRLSDQAVLWKRNSCGHPLGISLELCSPANLAGSNEETSEGSVGTNRFWDTRALVARTIAKNPQQLQKLFLKLNLCEIGNSVYELPSDSMSNLESLQLFIETSKFRTPEGRSITSFSKASNLRRVTIGIDQDRYSWNAIRIDLPWAQLTHLVVLDVKPFSFLHFVATECPVLQTLSVNLGDPPPSPLKQTTIMPNLQELSLAITGEEDLTFLSSISLPRLDKLRFCNNTSHPRTHHWTQPFTDNSNHFLNQLHLLQSLTLGFQGVTCDALLEFLGQTPLLVELRIDSELREYSKFLETLTYKPQDAVESLPVPTLEHFSLYVESDHVDGVFIFTNDSFFNMIVSRSNLVFNSNQHSDDKRSIRRPARLKSVFLCIEEVGPEIQIIDLEDLASRAEVFRHLDSGIAFTFDISSDKIRWLQEEVPIW